MRMVNGVEYLKVDDAGLHVRVHGEPQAVRAASANLPSAHPVTCMLEKGFDVPYFFCAAATSAIWGLTSATLA